MYSFMGEKRHKEQKIFIQKFRKLLGGLLTVTILSYVYTVAPVFGKQIVSQETILPAETETAILTTTGTTPKAAYRSVYARITGFNTVVGQTDATPCIAASGDDICGRTDVVACPRNLPLGTEVEIDGKKYVCLDRTNAKYNGRFDISCDKDTKCPGRVTGYEWVKIYD